MSKEQRAQLKAIKTALRNHLRMDHLGLAESVQRHHFLDILNSTKTSAQPFGKSESIESITAKLSNIVNALAHTSIDRARFFAPSIERETRAYEDIDLREHSNASFGIRIAQRISIIMTNYGNLLTDENRQSLRTEFNRLSALLEGNLQVSIPAESADRSDDGMKALQRSKNSLVEYISQSGLHLSNLEADSLYHLDRAASRGTPYALSLSISEVADIIGTKLANRAFQSPAHLKGEAYQEILRFRDRFGYYISEEVNLLTFRAMGQDTHQAPAPQAPTSSTSHLQAAPSATIARTAQHANSAPGIVAETLRRNTAMEISSDDSGQYDESYDSNEESEGEAFYVPIIRSRKPQAPTSSTAPLDQRIAYLNAMPQPSCNQPDHNAFLDAIEKTYNEDGFIQDEHGNLVPDFATLQFLADQLTEYSRTNQSLTAQDDLPLYLRTGMVADKLPYYLKLASCCYNIIIRKSDNIDLVHFARSKLDRIETLSGATSAPIEWIINERRMEIAFARSQGTNIPATEPIRPITVAGRTITAPENPPARIAPRLPANVPTRPFSIIPPVANSAATSQASAWAERVASPATSAAPVVVDYDNEDFIKHLLAKAESDQTPEKTKNKIAAFFCPISYDLIRDPVIPYAVNPNDATRTYEREFLQNYIAKNNNDNAELAKNDARLNRGESPKLALLDPITRAEITDQFKPDLVMKKAIENEYVLFLKTHTAQVSGQSSRGR